MKDYFSQSENSIRFEWGFNKCGNAFLNSDCLVIVDVMSFTTCVSIAVDRGASIYPYPFRDSSAHEYATRFDAIAAHSNRTSSDGYSLSPSSMMCVREDTRIVLPSPNGSTLAYAARKFGVPVFAASFRNLEATARVCSNFNSIAVIACGEKWPDGSLRPCLEDHLCAGALLASWPERDLSPEARSAQCAYQGFDHIQRRHALESCGSAMELKDRGFSDDVAYCLEENVSSNACILRSEHFTKYEGS